MQNKRRCILLVSLAAWLGLSLTILHLVHEDMRHELLQTGLRVAGVLELDDLRQFSFTAEDENNPRFPQISRELQHLATAVQLGWSPARNFVGIYTMRQVDGSILFGPESIPVGHPISSSPGTVYEEPPRALEVVFLTGRPILVGPFRDEYGTFMSVFLPLGEVGAPVIDGVVMGVDILFRDWLTALFWNSILPIGLVSAFLFALVSAAFALVKNAAVLPPGLSPCVIVLLCVVISAAWIYFLLHSRQAPSEMALHALREEGVQMARASFAESPFPSSGPAPLRPTALGLSPGAVVRLQGASTILPIIEAAAERIEPDGKVVVLWQGSGAAQGVRALREGLVDLAMLARAPTSAESEEFSALTLGWDALVVVVNENNPLNNITSEQLRDILVGRQRTWPEAPAMGSDAIVVVGRREGRASTAHLAEFLGLMDGGSGKEISLAATSWVAGANSEVLLWVGGLPNAIGYVSLLDARRFQAAGLPLRIIAIDGVAPSDENIRNALYPLTRPLTLLYRKDSSSPVTRVVDWFESNEGKALRKKLTLPAPAVLPKGEAP